MANYKQLLQDVLKSDLITCENTIHAEENCTRAMQNFLKVYNIHTFTQFVNHAQGLFYEGEMPQYYRRWFNPDILQTAHTHRFDL